MHTIVNATTAGAGPSESFPRLLFPFAEWRPENFGRFSEASVGKGSDATEKPRGKDEKPGKCSGAKVFLS